MRSLAISCARSSRATEAHRKQFPLARRFRLKSAPLAATADLTRSPYVMVDRMGFWRVLREFFSRPVERGQAALAGGKCVRWPILCGRNRLHISQPPTLPGFSAVECAAPVGAHSDQHRRAPGFVY